MQAGSDVNMTHGLRTSTTFDVGLQPASPLTMATLERSSNRSLFTTEFYGGHGVDDAAGSWSETGGSLAGSQIHWWPDDAPWFRVMLIILYGSVLAGCVIGKYDVRRNTVARNRHHFVCVVLCVSRKKYTL
jgi:hypothetical protein